MLSMDGKSEADLAKEAESEEFKERYEPAPKTDEGKDYILKTGRYGKFWAHPDYPKVKDAQPLVLKRAALIEEYGDIPKTDDGREFVLRRGRFGEFWAHPDYPDVKKIIRIKKKK
jgi:ssDNA-binding Zn-finger/Zn-ribbon topoisomerase 1